jgi:hypothetical protein
VTDAPNGILSKNFFGSGGPTGSEVHKQGHHAASRIDDSAIFNGRHATHVLRIPRGNPPFHEGSISLIGSGQLFQSDRLFDTNRRIIAMSEAAVKQKAPQLSKLFLEVCTCVEQYIRKFNLEVLGLGPFTKRLRETAAALTSPDTKEPLAAVLGPCLQTQFPFFFNAWLKDIYLPYTRRFYELFSSPDILTPLSHFQKMNQSEVVNKYLDLSKFFFCKTQDAPINSVTRAVRDEARKPANAGYFRERFFLKLDEFVAGNEVSEARSFMILLCAEKFANALSCLREVFDLGIPAKYMAGNLDLTVVPSSYIQIAANMTPEQMNQRFPTAAPRTRQMQDDDFDYCEVRRQMRQEYTRQFEEFEIALGQLYSSREKVAEIENVGLQFDDLLKKKREHIAKSTESELEKLRMEFFVEKTKRKTNEEIRKEQQELDRIYGTLVDVIATESAALARLAEQKGIAAPPQRTREEILRKEDDLPKYLKALENGWRALRG